MVEVDLTNIGFDMKHKHEAINWLYCHYGSINEGLWDLRDLNYVLFQNSAHATDFVLRWS